MVCPLFLIKIIPFSGGGRRVSKGTPYIFSTVTATQGWYFLQHKYKWVRELRNSSLLSIPKTKPFYLGYVSLFAAQPANSFQGFPNFFLNEVPRISGKQNPKP